MTIDYYTIFKDLLTWASGAKIVSGAMLHKIWLWLKAKYQAAKAEAAAIAKKL